MERIDIIDDYLKRLFPIIRSITGDGNRKTLNILKEIIPLNILEYSTGQKVYDWTIPKEWNIRDAWIKNSKGEKIIDFKLSNLHVVSYSTPIHKKIRLNELDKNLHYLENIPSVGDTIDLEDYKITINEVDDRSVIKVHLLVKS